MAATIPTNKVNKSEYHVPGWNTYVAEKHEIARDAYNYTVDGKW